MVEQRRLAQIRAAEQESQAARQHVHNLLHTAEQALAAGQLLAARAAADEIRANKPGAGPLPKPTVQRLSRLTQQLTDLERWESFGQHNARVQLCERAEAAATLALDAPRLAAEVQKLRNEWKALDQQHAGVPKALWERFDHACEKAYAPAARHFAEQAALRKAGAQAARGIHRRCRGARADAARRAARLARDRALAARDAISGGRTAISAASSRRRGRASMRGCGPRWPRCAMRCPPRATRRRRAAWR